MADGANIPANDCNQESCERLQLSKQLIEKETGRVCRIERIVQQVAIPIVALRIRRRLDKGIRLQEPAQLGVIDAPIHMNDTYFIHHFVPGVTTHRDGAKRGRRRSS
jgi:hypothetical protein